MPFYNDDLFKLDDESRKIAKSMGEDPAQKLSQIEVLRTWIMSHKYLECRTDDEFLLKFLRVAKFSCEAAKERITKYCIARSSKLDGMPEWFSDLDARDPKIRELLERGLIYHLPRLDTLGRMYLIGDMECLKGLKPDPLDMYRAVYLVAQFFYWKYERCQINGFVFVVNGHHFSMDLVMYLTPEKLSKTINHVQGALPTRMKLLEFYNVNPILKPFIEAVIAFFKPKMQKRVHTHCDFKPPDGGEFLQQLEDFQSELDSLKMCKVDDEKMPKHYEDGDSWGISGSYRTIQE